MTKKAIFTIDVDPLVCYYDIHGLQRPTVESDSLLVTALPRMLEWLNRYNIKATLFVTTEELGAQGRAVIAQAAEEGHEIASHSFSHNYALTQLSHSEQVEDIRKNRAELEEIVGKKPLGFRAPGYSMSDELYSLLKKEEFVYDASAFPSPFYYIAKWILIRLKALMGRTSRSIISSFSEAFAPRTPFLHKKTQMPIFPITTIGVFGWPMLGTALIVFPRFFFTHLLRRAVKKEYFHFEAHAIDAADVTDDMTQLEPLLSYQPDLKKKKAEKEAAFITLFDMLKDNEFQFVTLSEYAKEWGS